MRARIRITLITTLGAALLAFPAAASALTKTVFAGAPKGPTKKLAQQLLGKGAKAIIADSPAFLSFHTQTVTINAGDSVKWEGLGGGFHTVDFPAKGGADLPLFVHGSTVSGVNDAAGNPFWFDGTQPSAEFNPQLNSAIGGKTYNGTARVDSGGSATAFKLTFTKPGVYKYFCDIHPGMIGYVVVKAKTKPIPSAKADAATLTRELKASIRAAAKLSHTKPPADTVYLGAGSPGVSLYRFFPATLSVKAGTVVTFSVPAGEQTEGHTAAFGPIAYLAALSSSSSDAATQQTVYPSSDPSKGPIQVNSSSHGNGFANTGLLDQDPSGLFPSTEKIQFTAPGTYQFYCLIHPFMHGTIVVH